VVGHTLVNGANQVWACVGEFEAEVTADIGLGAGGLLHPLRQFDQHHVIPGGRLAIGSVLERACQSLSKGRRTAPQQHYENRRNH